MGLPLSHSPILEAEAEVGAAVGLHQIAEVMAVACITIKDVVRIAHLRAVGLHPMVRLRLLFTGLNLIDRACLQRLSFLLLPGQVVEVAAVAAFRKGEPVHHVARVVYLEEGHYFVADGILHAGTEGEVQRLAGDGL